jgi:hypothetical protein
MFEPGALEKACKSSGCSGMFAEEDFAPASMIQPIPPSNTSTDPRTVDDLSGNKTVPTESLFTKASQITFGSFTVFGKDWKEELSM